MCSVGRADVFSFGANVFSFLPHVFSFRPNVFTLAGHVFSLSGGRPLGSGGTATGWPECGNDRVREEGGIPRGTSECQEEMAARV